MSFKYSGNPFDGIVNYLKQIDQLDDIISIHVTSVYGDHYQKYIFHDSVKNHWVSENGGNEYIIFSFNAIKPIITHYSIRSHENDQYYLRSWSFWGSNDKNSWTKLHSKYASTDLRRFNVKTYKVDNTENIAYKHYKIKKEANAASDNRMRIAYIEFFGTIFGFPTCYISKGTFLKKLLLMVFVFIYSSSMI